ncbi:MAG: CbbQ/NirQ/NorQ/GpvN family protein [Marinospirillum sp.]|uniref:CbbQ/NirQ/NorQ/GpvN family protein n=1 Tax=Marinospirillum sp. TaxID=2183934 RepID=UPI001A0B095C|nr:CbbQ/NirQ/NorQ/GpvN family protein [Marinospirillum sp.]MBE0507273.1 CbbQ/NirQ/NorQ/GpvN family protein [Marinospirillum sp.]
MPKPLDAFFIHQQPFYEPLADEVAQYQAAYQQKMPVMLKGPTGCGKTRFVEYMAWTLGKPLISVACNEDMAASDLLGRFLLNEQGTQWIDGPLTLAARHGGICYLDEIVEARQDTTVVIHSLTDYRRRILLDKINELVTAHPDFQLVISYNPGYQSLIKELKPSTRQRFVAFEFDYPQAAKEAQIVHQETSLPLTQCELLVAVAHAGRRLKGQGLSEGISTRLLVNAAHLIQQGINFEQSCQLAMIAPVTDDPEIRGTLEHAVRALLPPARNA